MIHSNQQSKLGPLEYKVAVLSNQVRTVYRGFPFVRFLLDQARS
jgi:hypothetical protein